jgi:hypothetical protein
MKTAYGGTHFFSFATPTGMVPAQRMIAIHSRGNKNPSDIDMCVAAGMLSYRFTEYPKAPIAPARAPADRTRQAQESQLCVGVARESRARFCVTAGFAVDCAGHNPLKKQDHSWDTTLN